MMYRRAIAASAWLLLCLMSVAHSQTTLGFPPGTFNSRVAREGGGGGGTVVHDADGTEQHNSSTTSITDSTLTVGSGSNRALTVMMNFSLKTISGLSVVWDQAGVNQALSSITSGNSSAGTPAGRTEIWGVANPASGNKTLTISWTGASEIFEVASSWTGVNQSTPFPNSTSGNNGGVAMTTLTLSVTSATGDQIVGTWENSATNQVSVTGTQLYLDNINGSSINGAADYATASAGSTNMVYTTASDSTTSGSIVDIAHN